MRPTAIKKELNYFHAMAEISKSAILAADVLKELITNLNYINYKIEKAHEVKLNADKKYRRLVESLSKSFITPIDREDIKDLASAIDDVVDQIDDAVLHFYMFNIISLNPKVIEFCNLISQMAGSLYETMVEFEKYKKSKKIFEYILTMNTLAKKGDKIYSESIRELFATPNQNLEIIKWKEIYGVMKSCFDSCEKCADLIESVILKNS